MNSLLFSDTWSNISWESWNDTLLGQDLANGFILFSDFLQAVDQLFISRPTPNNIIDASLISDLMADSYFTTEYLPSLMQSALVRSIISCSLPVFYWFELSFLFLFFLFVTLNFYNSYFQLFLNNQTSLVLNYEIFLLVHLNMIFINFESWDEALNVIIFWPWSIMLIFSHLILWNNNELFFIFIEWGLPVVYGYFIICEYFWNFGSYFFIYLNGTRGRRSLIITILEDFIAFCILIASVSLQMIRGLICGLYHDFFRELTEFIIDTWDSFFMLYSWQLPFFNTTILLDIILFSINVYLIAFTLLFIYFVLFLQLLFLLIAVWLFARCWFISNVNPDFSNWLNLFN